MDQQVEQARPIHKNILMKLIIGLGNQGKKYEKTRHNVGFMVVDGIMSNDKCQMTNQIQNSPTQGRSPTLKRRRTTFKMNKRYNAGITEGNIGEEKIILVKPQTFMNESGVAVRQLITDYRQLTTDLIVIHDDVDLPFGTVRIKKGGGTAGHHGIESVIKEIGSSDFIRVRVGVGRESSKVTEYVLRTFNEDEQRELPNIIKKTADAVLFLIRNGLDKTMNAFN